MPRTRRAPGEGQAAPVTRAARTQSATSTPPALAVRFVPLLIAAATGVLTVVQVEALRWHLIDPALASAYALLAASAGWVFGMWLPRVILRKRVNRSLEATEAPAQYDSVAMVVAGLTLLTGVVWSVATALALTLEDWRGFVVTQFGFPATLTRFAVVTPPLLLLSAVGACSAMLLTASAGWLRLVALSGAARTRSAASRVVVPRLQITLMPYAVAFATGAGAAAWITESSVSAIAGLLMFFAAAMLALAQRAPRLTLRRPAVTPLQREDLSRLDITWIIANAALFGLALVTALASAPATVDAPITIPAVVAGGIGAGLLASRVFTSTVATFSRAWIFALLIGGLWIMSLDRVDRAGSVTSFATLLRLSASAALITVALAAHVRLLFARSTDHQALIAWGSILLVTGVGAGIIGSMLAVSAGASEGALRTTVALGAAVVALIPLVCATRRVEERAGPTIALVTWVLAMPLLFASNSAAQRLRGSTSPSTELASRSSVEEVPSAADALRATFTAHGAVRVALKAPDHRDALDLDLHSSRTQPIVLADARAHHVGSLASGRSERLLLRARRATAHLIIETPRARAIDWRGLIVRAGGEVAAVVSVANTPQSAADLLWLVVDTPLSDWLRRPLLERVQVHADMPDAEAS